MRIHFCMHCREKLVLTSEYVWVLCCYCANAVAINYYKTFRIWRKEGVEYPWFKFGFPKKTNK